MKTFKEFLKELTGNLGISRKSMPQIKSDFMSDFIEHLKSMGVKITKKKISVEDLSATQSTVNYDKIKSMIKNAPEKSLKKIIIVSRDYHILDGHHRWKALVRMNKKTKIDILQVNLPIISLIQAAKQFSLVNYKK